MKNRQVVFTKSVSFIENYNSKYRATVYKPVSEMKAVKMVQNWLDTSGMKNISINQLYKKENDIDSEQEDRWVFGLGIPGYMRISNIADQALDNLVDITDDTKFTNHEMY